MSDPLAVIREALMRIAGGVHDEEHDILACADLARDALAALSELEAGVWLTREEVNLGAVTMARIARARLSRKEQP